MITVETMVIFISRPKKKLASRPKVKSIKKFAIMIMEIFTKLFTMSKEASRILGSSSKLRILLAAGCCFVFSMLISLYDSEKNATSEPETRKDNNNNNNSKKTRIVIAV